MIFRSFYTIPKAPFFGALIDTRSTARPLFYKGPSYIPTRMVEHKARGAGSETSGATEGCPAD